MNTQTMKLKMCAFVAMFLTAVSCGWAAVPAAPTVTLAANINGRFNILVDKDANAASYEVEYAYSGESYVAAPYFSKTQRTRASSNDSWELHGDLVLEAPAVFRARAVNDDGVSDWVETILVEPSRRIAGGTPMSATASYSVWMDKQHVFDGQSGTYFDAGAKPSDVGLDFGSPVTARGVRFVLRYVAAGAVTVVGAEIQASDDPDFATYETLGSVATQPSFDRAHMILFDHPVTARYFRIKGGAYGYMAEMEFMPAELPSKPSVDVTVSNFTSFYPVISCTFPRGVAAKSWKLQRALASRGKYRTIAFGTDAPVAPLIDTDVLVGGTYSYRLQAVSGTVGYEDVVVTSDPVVFSRARRLERAWGDEAHMATGVTQWKIPDYAQTWQIPKAFDGATDTCPDVLDASWLNTPVGVAFSEGVHLSGCRLYSTANRVNQTRKAALHGSNESDLSSPTELTAQFGTAFNSDVWTYFPSADTASTFTHAYLRIPADKYDPSNPNAGWYGNVCEVQFYGWTQAEQDAAENDSRGLLLMIR